MSKYTLLEIVQSVHNDLNLDLVNSISDTTESVRVALMAKDVYFEMMSRRDWPHLRSITQLLNASSVTEKTTLRLPENISKLEWVTYNRLQGGDTRDRRGILCYQYPDQFVQRANGANSDATNIEEMTTTDGAVFLIRNDKQPQYWTSFDDENIVLDSYESDIESTVQGNKTQALMYRTPTWSATDSFVPDLPMELFPAFLAEVKSVASLKISEIQDAKAEQQAARQQRRMSNQAWQAHGGIRKPNYGRCPRGGYVHHRNPLFGRDN